MQKTIALKLTPSEVASQPILLNAIAQVIAEPSSHIQGYHILKQSIDARSRQQVWVNLSILVFINEAPSQRFNTPIQFDVLPASAKEVIIIGAGLTTFIPYLLYLYFFPFFIFLIGVVLLWFTDRKIKTKIIYTIIPVLFFFTYQYLWKVYNTVEPETFLIPENYYL